MFTQKELHLRQRRWLELPKDYGINILYHPVMANVVVDTLNRFSMCITTDFEKNREELSKDVHKIARLGVRLMDSIDGLFVMNGAESSLVSEVKRSKIKILYCFN